MPKISIDSVTAAKLTVNESFVVEHMQQAAECADDERGLENIGEKLRELIDAIVAKAKARERAKTNAVSGVE